MRIKLSVVSNLVFLFYKNMTCLVYLQDIIIFTVIFHTVCVSHYISIKSIDDNLYKKIIDAKQKKHCKSTLCTTEDKRV